MRNVKTLMFSACMAASMAFSSGPVLADGEYCSLLNPAPQSPAAAAWKGLLDQKITNPDDIVSKLLDPVAPVTPDQLQAMYSQVYEFVITNYIDERKLDKLAGYEHKYDGKLQTRVDLNNALADLISQMDDRWTWHVSASQQVQQVLNVISKQAPLGVGLRKNADGTFWIEHIDYGSTAQLSGLREGDTILAVNDKELKGMSKADAEKLFIGPLGNSLKVKSIQDGKTVEASYMLRAPLPNDAGAKLLKNNIAYLKLPNFMNEQDFGKIVMSMVGMAEGTPGGLQGIVLDLRYNGGGEVDKAKLLISFLLSQGAVISESSRDGRTWTKTDMSILPLGPYSKLKFTASQLAVLKDLQSLPLVVLVNGSSASAAEIVTGALKESRPNTIVLGERSFGKFQEMLMTTLPDCSKVAVTSARYTTPTGKWLQDVGIEPDMVVHQPRDSQDDAQMNAAMELLDKKTAFNPANIVRMPPESQPNLGPAPERPAAQAVDTDWVQVARENRTLLAQIGVGILLAGIFGFYLLLSRKKKSD